MDTSTATTLVKRRADDVALMPPPPIKRIKRPAKVLDEDDYTAALSDIIKRDYFPGLLESEAQQEYLAALESNNTLWIEEAGKKLIQASTPLPQGKRARNTRLQTPSATPRAGVSATATPRGWTGAETPLSTAPSDLTEDEERTKPDIDTSNLSLTAFQTKYTSEDNESFNSLLDRQNQKRREKHAYFWTNDQRLPSARQIAWKVRDAKLIDQGSQKESNSKVLIPIQEGATEDRPAKPDAWRISKPDNAFMFMASSVDEEGFPTVADGREAASKAGPKAVVYNNTRFPSTALLEDPAGPVPPSPSLNTSIIGRRDAARAAAGSNATDTDFSSGGETPRVNGYAFVDEDEPENIPQPTHPGLNFSYRDLLAGQVGEATPNPFKISETRKREDLHHRIVEKTAKAKRAKEKERTVPLTPGPPMTPGNKHTGTENMTPAARKLMERVGRTPLRNGSGMPSGEGESGKEMWTPVQRTPAAKAADLRRKGA